MDWLADLRTFAGRVGKKWWALVGGLSTVEVILMVVPLDFPLSLVRPLLSALVCLLLVIAAFDVWRKDYRRLQELEQADANIKLKPGLVEFELPRSWELVPNIIPPVIWLKMPILLVNDGTETGNVDTLYVRESQLDRESVIILRGRRFYRHHRQDRWIHNPIKLPIVLEPHKSLKVTYLLKAGIKETDPLTFAQKFGRLTDLPLTFAWAFHGVEEHPEQQAEVMVPFGRLRKVFYSKWHTEGRDDLTEIAQRGSAPSDQP